MTCRTKADVGHRFSSCESNRPTCDAVDCLHFAIVHAPQLPPLHIVTILNVPPIKWNGHIQLFEIITPKCSHPQKMKTAPKNVESCLQLNATIVEKVKV